MAPTLFDRLSKVYKVRVVCSNCGEFQELRIPKGEKVKEYVESEAAKCENCGCDSLRLKETKKEIEPEPEKKKDFKAKSTWSSKSGWSTF